MIGNSGEVAIFVLSKVALVWTFDLGLRLAKILSKIFAPV